MWLLTSVGAIILAVAASGCDHATNYQMGSFTEPSAISAAPAVPVSANLVWQTAAELGTWVNNPLSRNCELLTEGNQPYIRVHVGPDSFVLQSPELPRETQAVHWVRVVSRWQPSGPAHLLSVYRAILVPWVPQYPSEQAILDLILNVSSSWTAGGSSPIHDPGLPFVVRYMYFTAEDSATPGALDISRIELTP